MKASVVKVTFVIPLLAVCIGGVARAENHTLPNGETYVSIIQWASDGTCKGAETNYRKTYLTNPDSRTQRALEECKVSRTTLPYPNALGTIRSFTCSDSKHPYYPGGNGIAPGKTLSNIDINCVVAGVIPPKKFPCEVLVDTKVKQTTTATNRDDCYKQIGFGADNCKIYGTKGFFHPGDNFLDQRFNKTDRVTSEHCFVPFACQVLVDGIVKQTTTATDRDDCYKQIGFGADNCKIYGAKGFFPNPKHKYFLDQRFNKADRVTSENCLNNAQAN